MQLALTVLENNQDALLACRDEGEAMQLLTDYLEGVFNEELGSQPHNRDGDKVPKVLLFIYVVYIRL